MPVSTSSARLSWGRVPHAPPAHVIEPATRAEMLPFRSDMSYLPYGNGRSYGDSCLNPGAGLVRMRRLDRLIAWDEASGMLTCEAGTLLSDIIRFGLPRGWFLPVTPGTKFVTVGGAIANDVHGKNHHVAGSFGHHVESLVLQRSDRAPFRISRTDHADWFAATVGGLGLTGVVQSASVRLKAVPGPWLEQRVVRFGSLDEFHDVDARLRPQHEYTVAWVDCVASGRQRGRGLYIAADHTAYSAAPPRARTRRIPMDPPVSLVGPLTLRLFNWLYYHRPRASGPARVHYEAVFYPLDGVLEWNRIYGPRGFFQFQCVVPPAASRDAMNRILSLIAAHNAGSFLAVLKTFGDRPAEGLLSFPRAGTTLALDFPERGESTRKLFREMEAVVVDHGGAIYPAKDGLMSAAAFRAGFPRASSMAPYLDPRLSSQFARRVGLVS